MFECSVIEDHGLQWVIVKGRIDALSSPEIEKYLNTLILSGERFVLADLAEVSYISSAGLRLFISIQKQLNNVGGEIILSGLTHFVFDIFRMSGLHKIFRIVSSRDESIGLIQSETIRSGVVSKEFEGIFVRYTEHPAEKGSVFIVGSQDHLVQSEYAEEDVVEVKTSDMQFGTGFATIGEKYEEYKDLFGEAMVLNKNFFFYPAVKHPSVDFMINSHVDETLTYKFLYGFGFNGPYKYILMFEGKEGFVELNSLIQVLFNISHAKVLGMTILAESKGLWGMHLKRIPVREQRPANKKSIFDHENFPDWVDFPVEPGDINHIIAGTGIAMRDRSLISPEMEALIPEGSVFHIHAGIFEKGPLSRRVEDFEKEITRVLTELKGFKVQHILGQSRFNRGIVGIIELQD